MEHLHFNASNVSVSLGTSRVSDMGAQRRQLPFPYANRVLHTSKALLVIAIIILLSVVWLVTILLWSAPTYLSLKICEYLGRFHGGKLHGRSIT